MAAIIPRLSDLALGTFSYNGFTFDGTVRSKISGTAIKDQANRTTIYVEYVIDITFWVLVQVGVSGGDPHFGSTDQQLETLRNLLTQSGGKLVFHQRGFGELSVNDPTDNPPVRDVAYGPHPEIIAWDPIGADQGAVVEWRCTVRVPDQCTVGYSISKPSILAYNYEVTFSFDRSGLTTRTITGYIEIAANRTAPGAMTFTETADQYREQLYQPIPLEFRREDWSFHLSMDKRRLDFTFVDKQMPDGTPPPGMVSATGTYNVRHDGGLNFQRWHATIAADYVISPRADKFLAYQAFFTLYTDRFKALQNNTSGNDGAFLESFNFTEGLYENGNHISFSAGIQFSTSIEKIITSSGVFRVIPNTDGLQWAQSLQDITGVRGEIRLRNVPSEDVIWDVCQNQPSTTSPTEQQQSRSLSGSGTPTQTNTLKADFSWLKYENAMEIHQDPQTVSLKSTATLGFDPTFGGLGDPNAPALQGNDNNGKVFINGLPAIKMSNDQSGPAGGKILSNVGDGIQQRSTPSYTIVMTGYAVRVGYHIPCPSLLTAGGKPLVPTDPQYFHERTRGNLGGLPLYYAEWELTYHLPNPQSLFGLQLPSNPALFVPG